MQAKNLSWAVFSGFFALLLIVAAVLDSGTSVRAPHPASVPAGANTATPTPTGTPVTGGTGCAYTEIEPNSTITDANPIAVTGPTTVNGGITPAGDQDYYQFALSTGASFWAYVVTNQAAPSTDSVMTLLDSAGNTVQLDDDNGFQSTLSSAIAGAPITQTGTYFVNLRQFGGATILNPYYLYMDYTSGPDTVETESNDTLGTADAYIVGDVISATIPVTTDLDYYAFSLLAGDKVVIQVDGDPDRNGTNLSRVNQFNPNFQLLDGAGAPIVTVDSDSQGGNGGHLSENYVYTSTTTANYYVLVTSDPSTPPDDDVGAYRLHMYIVNGPCGVGTPTPTGTWSTATSTDTAVPPSSTATPTTTSTDTAIPPSATATGTSTNTPVPATSTQTSTTVPSSTNTAVPATSTNTAVAPSATSTAVASSTVAAATSTAVVTATVCTINFPDNQPGDTFYEFIQCLACRGVISGYPDGRFHAERNITRGQISKVVSNAAGFNEDPGSQIYADVPPGSTFYPFINRLTNRGIMSGYPCPERPSGGCSPDNPVIFLPNANATRGQLAKIVSNAAGFNEAVSGQFYADVPPTGEGSQFYEWIMRLTNRDVMSGYPCGGPGEGCDAQNRPYFRWNSQVTRGQAAKIVANTFFPNCQP